MKIQALRDEINGTNPDEVFFLSKQRILNSLDDIEVVTLADLPSSDPGVAGQVWNNAGVPEVIAG